MTRMEILARRPKRTLAALSLVLLAVGVTAGSGASFTAQSANPGNAFAAGTLTMSNSANNAAVLTASGMKPGDTATGTLDIESTGSLAGTFSLSRSALTDPDPPVAVMSQKLDVLVEDCGTWSGGNPPSCEGTDPDIYNGTLNAMTGSYSLGSYAAAAKHRYRFTVTFNSSADNAYQGDSATATFQWDATS